MIVLAVGIQALHVSVNKHRGNMQYLTSIYGESGFVSKSSVMQRGPLVLNNGNENRMK